MDSQALKILFIGSEHFAHDAANALRETGGTLERTDLEHAASFRRNI